MAGRRSESADGPAIRHNRRRAAEDAGTGADGEDSPDPKRRKIRKGTHSCWACKRKKIRCTFSETEGNVGESELDTSVCDGCRRRGTPCVSQDLPEIETLSATASHDRQVDDRLGRMEALVEMLVKNMTGDGNVNGAGPTIRVDASPLRKDPPAVPHRTGDDSRSTGNRRVQDTRAQASNADAGEVDEDGGGMDTAVSPEVPASQSPQTFANLREGYVALHKTGMRTPSEPAEKQQPMYTTWFGHQRGIEEEEIPESLVKPTGPATPASTVATSTTRVSSGDQNGSKTASSTGDSIDISCSPAKFFHDEYLRCYNTLAAAWPSAEDLDVILAALSTPMRSGLHKVLVCTPFSAALAAETPPVSCEPSRTVLTLPPKGSHLVIVAQRLLILASFLQHLHPRFDPDLKHLTVPHKELMHRAACAANTIVMGQDSLISSVEGVQCLVTQGILQANMGNLRRAWLSFRRALTVAQLIGLQRGFSMSSIQSVEPGSPDLLPQCLWFRIVYADRYLSLMLGLPQGAPGDNSILCPMTRQPVKPVVPSIGPDELESTYQNRVYLREIEEAHAIIVGRILERNEAWRGEDEDEKYTSDGGETVNVLSTQAIDLELQRATRKLPAHWWLTPTMSDVDSDDSGAMFLQTQRLIDQLFHYHLLTQLHLPYMLRRGGAKAASAKSGHNGGASKAGTPGSVDNYAYSKITCVSASREVLQRFLSLRSFQMATFFCRCIDFFALLASLTLCLAHLDSHRNDPQQHHYMTNDFLAHQRLSDRGMMERVLQNLEEVAKLNEDDALIAKSIAFLRRMLTIEDDAAIAAAASFGCEKAKEALQARAHITPEDLKVWVPFLGTIRISKSGILRVEGERCSLVVSAGKPQQSQEQGDQQKQIESGQAQQQPEKQTQNQQPRQQQEGSQHSQSTLQQQQPEVQQQLASGAPSVDNALFNNYSIETELPVYNPLAGLTSLGPGWPGTSNLATSSNSLLFVPDNNTSSPNNTSLSNYNPYMAYAQTGQMGRSPSGDDWTLQGVDFAFFENLLIRGSLDDYAISGSTGAGAGAGAGAGTGSGAETGPDATASASGTSASPGAPPGMSSIDTSIQNGVNRAANSSILPVSDVRSAGRPGDSFVWPVMQPPQ